jgi:sugar/nucleoside kinase (ribokinase family)
VGHDRFLEWTRGARFFFPNADEAAVLSGATDPETQLDILAKGYPIVVLKRGKDGAITTEVGSGRRVSASAPSVAVVDTSGAGDAFLGGFLGAYLRGEGIEASLRRGVELGSRSVTRLGARPPLSSPAMSHPP